jgi:hypothetical protein
MAKIPNQSFAQIQCDTIHFEVEFATKSYALRYLAFDREKSKLLLPEATNLYIHFTVSFSGT